MLRATTLTTFRDGKAVDTQVITWTSSPQEDNDEGIRQAAGQALAINRTFAAAAAPSNAQVVAQVRALSRQVNGLIRLSLGQLDGTD